MKYFAIIITLIFTGCIGSQEKITYGSDMCYYCKMSIIDNKHAALAVTEKGKVFHFDAIECLVPFLQMKADTKFRTLLVNDYENPGALLPAEESSFIISRSIPSPMGAFLSAFATKERAQTAIDKYGGDIFTWNELKLTLPHPH